MAATATLLCGPLLRYTYIDYGTSTWNGTILVVLGSSEPHGPAPDPPKLRIEPALDTSPRPKCLLSENGNAFWRFPVSVPLADDDLRVAYSLSLPSQSSQDQNGKEWSFWVPAKEETMRMLFHSCNGFSLGVTAGQFAGPVLWKDVLRIHAEQPLHVMIGGGDQVYSDAVRTEGPLKGWASIEAPRRRAKMPLTDKLKTDLDAWYFKNYCDWYSKEPFAEAAACIASLQLYDDHDIIDGYGSYEDKWMRAPIFLGIGVVAWKYYMLFQQHTPPQGESPEDPSWVLGTEKGPYIHELSRSICSPLGKRALFFGLDCRTERTLERVCYEGTYDRMFARLEKEVVQGQTNHLILLLGVPIAYPRLVWLEHLLSTHTVSLIRWLNKVFGIAGGVFNKFDGSAELLDDLNDHWCAHPHKKERNAFVERLQLFAGRKQVRVTILSGDVHLAAVGRFFSKASLGIPQNKDPRYMVNIVSSAITNAPPPNAIANMLDKRNKLHHLDSDTDENLMTLFYQNPDGKANRVNRTTLPARNYCIITEHGGLVGGIASVRRRGNGYADANANGSAPEGEKGEGEGDQDEREKDKNKNREKESEGKAEGEGEGDLDVAHRQTGGIDHPSASAPQSGTKRRYALDICIRAEVDPKSPEGRTLAYGFSVPFLES